MSGMTSLSLPQWYWYEVIGSVCVAIKWRGLLSPLGEGRASSSIFLSSAIVINDSSDECVRQPPPHVSGVGYPHASNLVTFVKHRYNRRTDGWLVLNALVSGNFELSPFNENKYLRPPH